VARGHYDRGCIRGEVSELVQQRLAVYAHLESNFLPLVSFPVWRVNKFSDGRPHEGKDTTDIVHTNLITLLGLHRAVRRNISFVNDKFWNICVCEFRSGEGSEDEDGQPLEQHDSG
jgi:hypothetical protein